MGIRELLLLAVGLSMDAFAVAVCKGFRLENRSRSTICSSDCGSAAFRR